MQTAVAEDEVIRRAVAKRRSFGAVSNVCGGQLQPVEAADADLDLAALHGSDQPAGPRADDQHITADIERPVTGRLHGTHGSGPSSIAVACEQVTAGAIDARLAAAA